MPITIGEWEFDGPFGTLEEMEPGAGVYLVLCDQETFMVPVDAGESEEVKGELEEGDRDCWKLYCSSDILLAVRYLEDPGERGDLV
ncbi:MAG: hypothetical protein ACLFUV_02875, partial [Methanomassiliicoccales archaeon]